MPAVTAYRSFSSTQTNPPAATTTFSSDDPEDNLDPEDELYEASCLGGADAELFELMLPSHPICITRGFSNARLVQKEVNVRLARLESYLSETRRLLRIRTSVYLDKKAHSVGQKSGTRSHIMLSSYNKKLEDAREHYNEDRNAILRLDPDGNWTQRYKELKKTDLRAAHEDENKTLAEGFITPARAPGEAQRQLSWIWKVPISDRNRRVVAGAGAGAQTLATQEEVSEGELAIVCTC